MLKLQNQVVSQFLIEIYGNKEVKENLLMKSISQKTKYHLRLLGDRLIEIEKDFFKKMQNLQETYYVEGKLPEDKKQEFESLALELLNQEHEIPCYEFTESDFKDTKTNEIVAGEGIYYNLIDELVFKKENPEN